jgi:phosphatidylinositol phospholipase C delta
MVVIKGRRPSNLNFDDYTSDDDVSDDGAPSTIYLGEANQVPPPTATAHHTVCPALAKLTLLHGSKLTDWESSIMNPTHHMHSYSENKVRSLARKTDRHQWTIYNQSHLSRTYPAGSRIDSSNYMPILPWSLGCQLVSLNFQTTDTPLLLNDGRFRENGGCGYVLKSDSVLKLQTPSRDPLKPMKVAIRVLSGSCLPKLKDKGGDNKCIDPYVRVSVFDVKNGVKEDLSTFQTGHIYNNGFFPIWNEEKFKFTVESWPSAMLQLTIFDKESPPNADQFVATAAIPISCLRQGLRCVRLNDITNTRSGAFDFASLLIDVTKTWGDATDLAKRTDSFGTDHLPLQRSRTDNSRGSKGVAKPSRVERSRTDNSKGAAPDPRLEKTKLVRSRTDQSKGETSLSSLAEF